MNIKNKMKIFILILIVATVMNVAIAETIDVNKTVSGPSKRKHPLVLTKKAIKEKP